MYSFESRLTRRAHWMTTFYSRWGIICFFIICFHSEQIRNTYENCATIIANRNLFSIGGGGSSGKSRGGEDVVDGEVLVEGEETRGEGGTGT